MTWHHLPFVVVFDRFHLFPCYPWIFWFKGRFDVSPEQGLWVPQLLSLRNNQPLSLHPHLVKNDWLLKILPAKGIQLIDISRRQLIEIWQKLFVQIMRNTFRFQMLESLAL